MAYQVLARKWRPSNFTQLVGQEHVSQSLMHALQHDRLHHAYLFTGTRGVGKTTVARILAKAINCENLKDFNPCGECQVCRDFEQGRFMDLIEVDAASRTKVEDTRDLLDNAQYAPNQGRYKVYLIDEVHMLSGHSFNALLKTLEEPPPHVKFLLATTDPHKIPVTVLSRCLQFNLKRLLPEQIATQMQFILGQEQIAFEPAALKMLGRAADGSLRDGLSLLDQAIVYGSGSVTAEAVIGMLGTVAQQPIDDMLQALVAGDARVLLAKIADVAELTPDFADILQQMLRVLHRVALLQQTPDFVDHEFDKQLLESLAKALLPEDVQLYYQIGLIGQRDLPLAPDPRSGFEMVMLRMLTFRPQAAEPQTVAPVHATNAKPAVLAPASVAPLVESTRIEEPRPAPIAKPGNWTEIIAALNISGRTRELANNCVLDGIDDSGCRLLLDPSFQQVGTKAEDNLRAALQNYYGKSLKLVITQQAVQQMTPALEIQKAREDRQQAAVDSINADENVQALKDTFGARIMPGSIEPLN
ncbi:MULTISPECIES: DNA polymerase III subunit gamma/tau [Methylomonas]|uniref:DNA polymerase III subunit gamma/tau n=2 Tax=Methylomonas TaxID=416 RepID=A0A126T2B2_9GAMM|nr:MULTISPECIES: DNA polymerase III subunit gamma/tau [Methylomonas]AMK76223.1 DNA polymerase III subunit gamma/tau [Methylomonas denitrificans]OAI00664.1 DNA polymerase III subunit gamma/tau [Methylomonas methanica]TCV88241.1 DNA polymerase-3 subunit gamma/tau [Methylomonas methanica]